MTMRAPSCDLPIVFEDVSVAARRVTILDRICAAFVPARRRC